MATEYIKREYYQGKLVAYMKRNDAVLRYRLCKIDKKYLTPTNRIKPTYKVHDPEKENVRIDELESKIDGFVKEILYSSPDAKITNKVIDQMFVDKAKPKDDYDIDSANILIYDFDKYIEAFNKKKVEDEIKNRGLVRKGTIHPSTKDYISVRNALDDYEYDNKIVLHLEDIDEDFIDGFIDYLTEDRAANTEEYIYKTKGGLVNKTINKRLDSLSAFIRHFYKNNEITELVTSFHQSSDRTEIIRLNYEELNLFASFPFEEAWELKIQEYFVFLCSTGIRFSDLISIDKNNFVYEDDVWFLNLYNQKTIRVAQIILTKRAQQIAEENNYEFRRYTNQAFNKELKVILRKYSLFEERTIKFRQIRQKVDKVEYLKRERISAHTGRRTFISILVENGTPLNIIKQMTAHTSDRTINLYIDKFSPKVKQIVNPLEL